MKSVSVISKYLNHLSYSQSYEQNSNQEVKIFNPLAISWFLNLDYLKNRASNFQSILSKRDLIRFLNNTPEDALSEEEGRFLLKYKELKALCLNFKVNQYGEVARILAGHPIIDLTLKKTMNLNDIIELLKPENNFLKAGRKYLITIESLTFSVDFFDNGLNYFAPDLGVTENYDVLTEHLKEKIKNTNQLKFSISIVKNKLGIFEKLKEKKCTQDLFFIQHQINYIVALVRDNKPTHQITYALSALARGDQRLGQLIINGVLKTMSGNETINLLMYLLINAETTQEKRFLGLVLDPVNKSLPLINLMLDRFELIKINQNILLQDVLIQLSLKKIFEYFVDYNAHAVITEWLKREELNSLKDIFSKNILFNALRSNQMFMSVINHFFKLKLNSKFYNPVLNYLASEGLLDFLSPLLTGLKSVCSVTEYQSLVNEALFHAALGRSKKESCEVLRMHGAVFGYEKIGAPGINYLTIYLSDFNSLNDSKDRDFGVYLLQNNYIIESEIDAQKLLMDFILNSDESAVDLLLKNTRVDVNFDDGFGLSPLDRAISQGSIPMVKLLIHAGADPYRPNQLLNSAPILTAHKNKINFALIKQLIGDEESVVLGMQRLNQALGKEYSLVQMAVERNSIALVNLYNNYQLEINETILEFIENKITILKRLQESLSTRNSESIYEMKKEFRKLECLKEHSFFAVDVIKFNELIHSKLAEIYEEVIGSLSLQRQLKEFIQEILADKEIAKAAIDVDLMDAEVTAHLSEEDGSSSFRHVDSEEAKLNSRFQFLSVIAEEQSFSDADDEEFSNLDDDAIHLGSLKDPLRFRICSRLNTGVLTPVSRK